MKKYNSKKIKIIINELELPKNTIFKGYVINLPENNEYLAEIDDKNKDYIISYKWSVTPEIAIIFNERKEAIKIIKEYDKREIILCLLFDIGKQYIVITEKDALEFIN